MIGTLTVAACQRAPEPLENLQLPVPSPTPTGGRMRYEKRQQPVFIAPDGSRHPIASLLAVPRKMAFGDFVWSDPAPGTGHIWIWVDLPRQLISVFRDTNEIGTAVIVYGLNGKATPSGTFSILGKERMHRSSSYDADMPYTLWLTKDGVAIHASVIERGRATHGCIGIPMDFARTLFAVARRGDVVFVLPAPPGADLDT